MIFKASNPTGSQAACGTTHCYDDRRTGLPFLEKYMKKLFIILLIGFLNINLFAQDFPFPPELKWWIFEIQKHIFLQL